jgi:heme/copper-type cytochrome/quinol oxidase subunit 2
MKRRDFLRMILIGSGAAALPRVVAGEAAEVKEFHIKLKRYTFTPSVIRVNHGDRVRLTIEGLDLKHGLYVDGYDLNIKVRHAEAKTIEFVADKSGSFRIRCSVVCGPLHPFMTGKLVVAPNSQFFLSAVLSFIVPFGALLFLHLQERGGTHGD